MNKQIKASIKKITLSVAVIIALGLAVYAVLHALGWIDMEQEELQKLLASTGAAAPLTFILISFLQVTLLPLPGTVTVLAGCYLFGAFYAAVYSFIGMLLGACAAFALGKLIGRPFINWVAGGADIADGWLNRIKGKETVLLFFMFLFPAFPDDLLCAVAGISLRFPVFLVMQIISRIASIAGTVLLMSREIIPFEGVGLVILALIVIVGITLFIISMRCADKINAALDRLANKITLNRRHDKDGG